ncbi:helix-turn-helix domain-containing protein [Enterococcus sp. CWB-B31]|uniref:helix-turn-helix domain-containing protein n=1 Tax=Enterococcus sp. CWB-B31 TaxID=2885159 RepID=UPI001E3DE353|nr:helix-turn-helix domain-containing protein [Enterococcus sp. CWB-B31]MCB5956045.1 helix-turn-helix domain-containing protein [Enterococcus sp. CWB-B31]
MRVESLLDKKKAREIRLLKKVVLEGGQISDAALIKYLNISKASLENDLKALNCGLKVYGNDCCLFYDGQQIKVELAAHFSMARVINDYLQQSLKFQLIDYLFIHREFTIIQLTNKFMISESSLFRKIRELNVVLKEFDIQIKNGHLKGEELQIRYFYFQIYWFLTPYEKHLKATINAQNERMIDSLEKGLTITLDQDSRLKLSLWLTISKRRLTVPGKIYRLLKEKSSSYETDPMFQQLRSFILRYFSRYPLEIDNEESMLHFIFLTSMFVLSEEDIERYGQIRGRRTPTSLADTFMLEHAVLYYRPQKFFPTLERKIFYYFSQIHSRLYFFKGELEIFDKDNIWEKEEKLSGHHLMNFSKILLSESLDVLGLAYEENNSLYEWSLVKYVSLLAIIDFEMMNELQIGIDLKMDPLYRDAMTQVLILSLKNVSGVRIEEYRIKKNYDLIITNRMGREAYSSGQHLYVLSELGSAYDIEKIKKKIRQLYQKSNR